MHTSTMQSIDAHILAELSEFSEAGAIADIFAAAPMNAGQRAEPIAGAMLLIAPAMPMIIFNRVLGLGLRAPIDDAVMQRITATYRDAGVSRWAIQIAPEALNPATEALFAAHGLRRVGHWEKVYRPASTALQSESNLTVRTIGQESAQDFAAVCASAFGMPASLQSGLAALVGRRSWQHCMAFDGDLPVACGALYVVGKVGWLGMGGTLTSHRRRGAQGALMALRVREAAAAGCEWVIAETGADTPAHPNPSFHNMLRTGFLRAYQRPEFLFEAVG